MVNYPNYLAGSQDDINKRFLKMILDLQKGDSGENTKISALETAVGDNTKGLVKKANDLETAIGDDETAGSIKGRLYALEHPASNGGES